MDQMDDEPSEYEQRIKQRITIKDWMEQAKNQEIYDRFHNLLLKDGGDRITNPTAWYLLAASDFALHAKHNNAIEYCWKSIIFAPDGSIKLPRGYLIDHQVDLLQKLYWSQNDRLMQRCCEELNGPSGSKSLDLLKDNHALVSMYFQSDDPNSWQSKASDLLVRKSSIARRSMKQYAYTLFDLIAEQIGLPSDLIEIWFSRFLFRPRHIRTLRNNASKRSIADISKDGRPACKKQRIVEQGANRPTDQML